MLKEKIKKQDILSSFHHVGQHIQFPLLISDPSLKNEPIVYVNNHFSKLLGVSSKEIIGQSKNTLLKKHFNVQMDESNADDIKKQYTLSDGSRVTFNYSEEILFDDIKKPILSLSTFIDITKYKEDLYKATYFDLISGLPNYEFFIEKFKENKVINGFILLIQPGEYANIVDAFGKNHLGLLQLELSKRIGEILIDIPTVIARATEGALIVLGTCEEKSIAHYVDSLLQAVNEPIVMNDIELFISLKIGATSLKYYNDSIDEIVRLANLALTISKKQAGNSIVFYEDYYTTDLKYKIAIQNELVHAIRNKELTVHLQPKVNVNDGEIVSFEALARWNSSKFGHVSPAIFIEAAEVIGKINELDFLVINQVLHWMSSRKASGLPLYQVSVNISPSHFYTANFSENLFNLINQSGVEPKYIKIELTENIGLVDLERAKQIIHELNDYGFECSVDDFGIGFSSLSYLHQLPVQELKIDRSFINNLDDHGGNAIVKTIIQLASNMNLVAVAEGIESQQQLEMIQSMSCQVAQGYYFYKPMALEKVDEILKAQNKL